MNPSYVVGLYSRVGFGEEEPNCLLDNQEKHMREFCKQQQFPIAEEHVYRDLSEGISPVMERNSFKRLVAALSAGEIQGVVFYALDRVTRNASQFQRLCSLFDEENWGMFSSSQQSLQSDDSREDGLTIPGGALSAQFRDYTFQQKENGTQKVIETY